MCRWKNNLSPSFDSARMTTVGFSVESMIHGYHKYKSIWDNPSVSESLICEREVGNCYDTHAVAIKKNIEGEIKTVSTSQERFLPYARYSSGVVVVLFVS